MMSNRDTQSCLIGLLALFRPYKRFLEPEEYMVHREVYLRDEQEKAEKAAQRRASKAQAAGTRQGEVRQALCEPYG